MNSSVFQFPGTEGDFYAVVHLVCASCIANIDAFAGLKPKYTPAFVQAINDSATAASQLPTNQQRQAASRVLFTGLVSASGECLLNATHLFLYIGDAFPAEIVEARKKEAGSDMYRAASNQQWASVTTLNSMMALFIDTYSEELTAAGMAEDFPATCDASAAAFTTGLNNYRDNKNASKGQTSEKTAANNDVYARLVSLMADGRTLFAKDEYRKKQFIYKEVLKTFSKPGKTGFRIAVMNKTMNEPIANAHISFTNSSATGITNKKGVIRIELPEGTFSYIISATGFTTQIGTLTATKYVMHRHKILLTPGSGEEVAAAPVVKLKTEKAAQ